VSATLGLPPIDLGQAVLLHIGSLLAILAQYGVDGLRALRGRWGWRLPAGIVAAGALTAVIALPLHNQVLEALFGNFWLVTLFLLANGATLLISGVFLANPARAHVALNELRWGDFILLGVLQGVAVLPGISRLGMTVVAGLRAGLSWQDALRLSFLLGIPTIVGAGLLELRGAGVGPELGLPAWIGMLLAAAGTALALLILQRQAIERRFLTYFGFYCLAFGLFCLVLALAG
jgi:undecaprenyl-diphosphatase